MPEPGLSITDRERISRIEIKVDSIYVALLGSEITDDGGMVARLKRVEDKVDITENELNRYKWGLVAIATVVPVIVTIILFVFRHLNLKA